METEINKISSIDNNKTIDDKLTERIYDNIHGFVSLTKKEKELLSNPYMRRLHFIKQNAIANFVFPGATHTRFAHSIGVLFIAEKMYQRIKSLNKLKTLNTIDHQVIRLAALLHDIGHYPLSHTIEASYQEFYETFISTAPTALIENEEVAYRFNPENYSEFLKPLKSTRNQFHHEEIAKLIITETVFKNEVENILIDVSPELSQNKIRRDSYIDLIGDIINGDLQYSDNLILKDNFEEQEKYYILSQIINSQLDADQMDYMLRDTQNMGIQATVRSDFLIDNIDICKKNIEEFKGSKSIKCLCFKTRAFQALQQFILSKYFWYSDILNYDRVSILNLIAKRLNTYFLCNQKANIYNKYNSYEAFKKLVNNPAEFFFFNDNFFWNLTNNVIQTDSLEIPKIVKQMASILIENKCPRSISYNDFSEIEGISNFKQFYISRIISSKVTDEDIKTFEDKVYKYSIEKGKKYFPIMQQDIIYKVEKIDNSIKQEPFLDRSINLLLHSCRGVNNCNSCSNRVLNIIDSKFEIGDNLINQSYEVPESPVSHKRDHSKDIYEKPLVKFVIFDFSNSLPSQD